jgi:hypothetical protein
VVLEKDGEDQMDRSSENVEALHGVKEERSYETTTKKTETATG